MRSSAEPTIRMQPLFTTKSEPGGDCRQTGLSGRRFLRVLLCAVVLTTLNPLANGEALREHNRPPRLTNPENPQVATELTNVVEGYIAAGEKGDPAARGKYLGPKLFYYGHARTREQAVKAIASLYRRWPERKFTLTESIDLFEVPNHQGVYRVTAVYEYQFANLDEHLSGKSKLTCVVEHEKQGARIIGLDEKLVNGSTEYQGQ